jgi:Uma2 family endonuclease
MSGARALHQSHTFAPWAEVVQGVGRMWVEDLLALPTDDGRRYELVEGVLVRVAGSGELATTVAATVLIALGAYVRPRRLGVVTGADGVYTFPNAETGLLPDVGFYVAARRAQVVNRTKPIPFAPDLAVEVVSPSQDADDMAAKAQRYLRGGTQLVWVVWPEQQRVDVWRAGGNVPTTMVRFDEMLSGEDVVPGFTISIGEVFADPLD